MLFITYSLENFVIISKFVQCNAYAGYGHTYVYCADEIQSIVGYHLETLYVHMYVCVYVVYTWKLCGNKDNLIWMHFHYAQCFVAMCE